MLKRKKRNNMIDNLNLKELAEFLIEAKKETYANTNAKEIKPQRPDFKELEYKKKFWEYRDSYCGFYFAPGQEIVRCDNVPVWAMAYSGGMYKKYHGDLNFAKDTFNFLKIVLSKVNINEPYRGPKIYKKGKFEYINVVKGDITDFFGTEKIYFNGKLVFKQNYVGGLIINK